MYTNKMIGVASQNERTYECPYGTYNKEDGFVLNEKTKQDLRHMKYLGDDDVMILTVTNMLNQFFHDDMWKIVKEPEPKKMTLADIEKELGYRVQVVDPELDKPTDKKKELTEEEKEDIDETIQFFKDLFGIRLDPKKYK